jgi:hypothetical protein
MAKEVGQGAPKGEQVAAELVELAEGARVAGGEARAVARALFAGHGGHGREQQQQATAKPREGESERQRGSGEWESELRSLWCSLSTQRR